MHYVQSNENLFGLNKTYMSKIRQTSTSCGFHQYLDANLHFPPKGRFPPLPPQTRKAECRRLWGRVKKAAQLVNPCFNYYQIATTCPLLWDVLGFPGSFEYLPAGTSVYFNRTDVKKAINAPLHSDWAECKDVSIQDDQSPQSSYSVLPRVIERSERTIISHGSLDYILMTNGTLLTIQNMTWNGKQGFQRAPSTEFFVPYHHEASLSTIALSGIGGTTHTERGLTWVEVPLSGHMVPQYAPSVAYRQLEFLLGRIKSLEERTPFTTQGSVTQPEIVPQAPGSPQGGRGPAGKGQPGGATGTWGWGSPRPPAAPGQGKGWGWPWKGSRGPWPPRWPGAKGPPGPAAAPHPGGAPPGTRPPQGPAGLGAGDDLDDEDGDFEDEDIRMHMRLLRELPQIG
jgi:hypothetical protein